jgi:hypothetical protein
MNAALENIKILALDPAAPYKIFAGTSGSAVFKAISDRSSLDASMNVGGAAKSETIG